MSRQRTLEAQLKVATASAGLLVAMLAGCESYSSLIAVPIDCDAEVGYDIHVIGDFETKADFWTAGDPTPEKEITVTLDAIPDGGRCGSRYAARLHSWYNNDWGSLFGFNQFGTLASPSGSFSGSSDYEGISFWARAPGNTTKGFTLLLNDPNTLYEKNVSNCDVYNIAGVGDTVPVTMDPNTGVALSGGTVTRAIYPDECGNAYAVVMSVTSDWAFYTVSFAAFHQDAKPNRVPNAVLTQAGPVPGTGLLTDQLKTLIVRMPKEAMTDLWLDNLAFYRRPAM